MVPMCDGVRLATDVYLPHSKPAPVILMRTPYNKEVYSRVARNRAAAGYACVVQDSRGRFASEGANLPFEGDGWWDKTDGYDTLEWIATQPWCNGRIGMHAGSAMGIAQFMAAATGTRRLSFLRIPFATPNIYAMAYSNGLFKKSLVEAWLAENKFAQQALDTWMSHPTYDSYWSARDARDRFNKFNVPALHIGGWYDIFASGTLEGFMGLQAKGGSGACGRQKLIMGPYPHTEYEQRGELTFPGADEPPWYHAEGDIPWFDFYLKGIDNGISGVPVVTYYVMGDVADPTAPGNCWRTADAWPPFETRQRPLYLHADLTLGNEIGDEKPLSYDYDPEDPVPTIGGPQYFLPAGPMDQRRIEARRDLLVFTGKPLAHPLEITGRVALKLWASTDAPDTDFIARLCDVYPGGRSINICEGGVRARLRESLSKEVPVEPRKAYLFDIDLGTTSIIVNRRHRIRVHITSSSYPGYAANSNSGKGYPRFVEPRVAHNTVYMGAERPSRILLPVRD